MKSSATLLFVVLGIAMAASAQEIDRFHHFREHGVMDPSLSADSANSLVREGIESGDSEVVDTIIRGLGNLAAVIAHDLPLAYGRLPTRTFQTVPGLKRFLIEYWREQHERAGRNTFEAIRAGLGLQSSDGITVTSPSPTEWGLAVNEAGEPVDPDAYIDELSKRLPAWPMIPQILSVYWPEDSEVELFLYEMRDTDRAPNTPLAVLSLLNTGRFTSEAANAFRIAQLENPDVGVDVSLAVRWAAEGLALSRPVDALPALFGAGVKYPAAQGAVLVAVAGYDESQLELYTEQISRLMQGGVGAMASAKEAEAYDRLIGILEGLAE